MDLSKFTELKNKIKQAELDSASAQGKKQTIESDWKVSYGFTDLASAQAKLEQLQQQNKDKAEKRDKLISQLEQMLTF